ncbi:hypothetical protein UT300005_32900 [Clostridium sp. CTA-5]
MKSEQLQFETKDFFSKQENKVLYSSIISKNDYYYLKAMIFKQSSRIVYRSVLSFWDVEKLCKHTSIRPEDDKKVLLNLNNIKNRYLEPKHGKEIILYVKNNIEDFILPNLTTVVDATFPIVYNVEDEKQISTEIFSELKQNNGCIFAYIKIPKNTVFTISDGNHRTYAIHQLIKSEIIDTDIEGLYVGIDFYLEVDREKEKQLFVTLNTNKSIDSSVMSLLKENDMISNATKSLLGIMDNYNYLVTALYPENKNYIGVDLVNDNVSKSSNTISFNMIKNIISILSLDNVNGDKKFQELYYDNKLEYIKLMKKISAFLNYIFINCEPFNQINYNLSNVKELREEYISMTGAGLYTIAKIGHIGIQYDGIDMEKLAKALCKLEWKRINRGNVNQIFIGGILTSEGKISNNRTALNTTTEKIKKILKLTDKDINKIIK